MTTYLTERMGPTAETIQDVLLRHQDGGGYCTCGLVFTVGHQAEMLSRSLRNSIPVVTVSTEIEEADMTGRFDTSRRYVPMRQEMTVEILHGRNRWSGVVVGDWKVEQA